MVIAADRKQARMIMRYCIGLLREVPMLAPQIESETQERISICATASPSRFTPHRFASTRGYTLIARPAGRNGILVDRRRQCRA